MPNPRIPLNMEIMKKLSDRQKKLVQNIKEKHKFSINKIKVYKRKGKYSIDKPNKKRSYSIPKLSGFSGFRQLYRGRRGGIFYVRNGRRIYV